MYDKELREVRDKLEALDQQRLEEGDRTKDFTIHLSTTANEIKFLERDLKELEIKVILNEVRMNIRTSGTHNRKTVISKVNMYYHPVHCISPSLFRPPRLELREINYRRIDNCRFDRKLNLNLT